ncbi:hypothetical protein QE440_001820 [Pseudomonas psychrotolerans]|uniref:Uncharacterized protein n=1 Tax=Pseudomonas oryzihabitans TaxID=47885 RepID=A0AAJ2BH17_9PSED|nr:hypothetical protein [Pseudomonas psychrotolerans]
MRFPRQAGAILASLFALASVAERSFFPTRYVSTRRPRKWASLISPALIVPSPAGSGHRRSGRSRVAQGAKSRSVENGAAFSTVDCVARGALTPALSQGEREPSEQAVICIGPGKIAISRRASVRRSDRSRGLRAVAWKTAQPFPLWIAWARGALTPALSQEEREPSAQAVICIGPGKLAISRRASVRRSDRSRGLRAVAWKTAQPFPLWTAWQEAPSPQPSPKGRGSHPSRRSFASALARSRSAVVPPSVGATVAGG